MNTTILVAVISTATALIIAAMSYGFSKRQEREAEWRKLKLDHYREFIAAFSGSLGSRLTKASHERRADAVNLMTLVAPPAVLRALSDLEDAVRKCNPGKVEQEKYDRLLGTLLREMRRDVHPESPDDRGITFELMAP